MSLRNESRTAAWALVLASTLGCATPDAAARDAAADDAAAGADAALAPDASTDDAGAQDAASASECADAADCDDHVARTTDSCVFGHCVHRECSLDTECADGDDLTTDLCVVDAATLDSRCENALIEGRCRSAADCDDLLACTSEDCVAMGYCIQTGRTPACGVLSDPITTCPSESVAGASCHPERPVALPSPCIVPGTDSLCPETLSCVDGDLYARVLPAGPACASACPTIPPARGTHCPSTTLMYCDYGLDLGRDDYTELAGPVGQHPIDHPLCRCNPGGDWACVEDRCPISPPHDGDPVATDASATPSSGVCPYPFGERCTSVGGVWRCLTQRVCPAPAPMTHDACDRAHDDTCSYARTTGAEPPTTYTGSCTCDPSSQWSCSSNFAATCPATMPMGLCSSDSGNQSCRYGAPGSWMLCQCQSFNWVCRAD